MHCFKNNNNNLKNKNDNLKVISKTCTCTSKNIAFNQLYNAKNVIFKIRNNLKLKSIMIYEINFSKA